MFFFLSWVLLTNSAHLTIEVKSLKSLRILHLKIIFEVHGSEGLVEVQTWDESRIETVIFLFFSIAAGTEAFIVFLLSLGTGLYLLAVVELMIHFFQERWRLIKRVRVNIFSSGRLQVQSGLSGGHYVFVHIFSAFPDVFAVQGHGNGTVIHERGALEIVSVVKIERRVILGEHWLLPRHNVPSWTVMIH